jgi:hypothetical protein
VDELQEAAAEVDGILAEPPQVMRDPLGIVLE